jgi:hypothetical protein
MLTNFHVGDRVEHKETPARLVATAAEDRLNCVL